ncbi:MAG: hypothetical protein QS2022_0480 [Candidatus Phytoplasma asteris]|nr:hypothetical protein ['Chrysanthemum coronarium' phytoplasma]TKA88239.1 MAG: hypothetical protein PLY_0480 [Periwinkle leaf yellowing phytoplasma]WEX19338.1 MAG: hypothetical protein QS2022_0480 [Candidatus Phytoplasma asteris]
MQNPVPPLNPYKDFLAKHKTVLLSVLFIAVVVFGFWYFRLLDKLFPKKTNPKKTKGLPQDLT